MDCTGKNITAEDKESENDLFLFVQLVNNVAVRFSELYLSSVKYDSARMIQLAAWCLKSKDPVEIISVLDLLKQEFEDYLLHHSADVWLNNDPLVREFRKRKIRSNSGFKTFVDWVMNQPFMRVYNRRCPMKAMIAANSAILLIKECAAVVNKVFYLPDASDM